MATYGNTGGNGLNINVYSGSGGNLSEWALDYDGMKLLTIPEVITASNITTNQAVTVTLKAKPIFTNITVSFFRVKFPDGTIAEYPATNNSAVFTTTVTAPLGSQQTLLVYARDNSGNRSAVAQHQYTIINSNPPSTNTITHNIPSNFNAGDVKQIQISGAVDPEGDAYTYTLILPEEISGSKISGISNNETVTLTVQNTIQYTKMDKIIIRVTDINGAQNDKVLDITMLSGGSSGGTNNFNVRTSFPSSVYQNEVFAAKIWELGTNNYTYGLNLPNGITSSKTTGILSNENFTITIAPSVIPNSTVSIDVVVYTGSVSVGSFVVNMLVDGVTGEMSYTTPGTYEFTVPNSVDSISMLQVYSNKITEIEGGDAGFSLENLSNDNILINSAVVWDNTTPNNTHQMNNMLYYIKNNTFTYTLDNFDTVLSATLPGATNYVDSLRAYGNGSYLISGTNKLFDGSNTVTNEYSVYLSTNNGLTFTEVVTARTTNKAPHVNMDYYNSVFYIVKSNADGGNLVSIDNGYTFIDKPLPTAYRNCIKPIGGVISTKDGYLRLMYNVQGDNRLHVLQSTDRCDTWTDHVITASSISLQLDIISRYKLFYCNNRYFVVGTDNKGIFIWTSTDLLTWVKKEIIDYGSLPGYDINNLAIGSKLLFTNNNYYLEYSQVIYSSFTNMSYIKFYDDFLDTARTNIMSRDSTNILKNNLYGLVQVNNIFLTSFSHISVPGVSSITNIQGVFLSQSPPSSGIKDEYVYFSGVYGLDENNIEFYICNNEIVCLSRMSVDIVNAPVPKPVEVRRIKLNNSTQSKSVMYLTTDLSDKNVTIDHTVPNMDFRKVVLSGDTFIAINRLDDKIYRNTIGSNVWELLSGTLPTYSSANPVYIQTFKPNIVVIYTFDRLYYSDNSGVTWVSHPVNNCHYVTIHKNSIYYVSANRVHRLNYTTGGDVEFTNTSANYIYSLGDVLIAINSSSCYYYDENDNNPETAFKDITAQYFHLLPRITNTSFYTNVSSKYIHGVAEIMQNNYTPPSRIKIYNETIKSITKNNIINNVNLTTNIITSSSKISTDGCYSNQYYIHDDFIIFITGYVLSVSTDGGDTFTSINTGDGIIDVVAHNGVLYIFSGNTVKKIVPSIMDNSNIINKDPNIGYSLVNPKQSGNFGKNGYAKYLNNIEVTPGEKIKINVTAPDGGVRLVWGTNRYFPTNAS